MLGLGWTEMLVIGVAALIFIGPKDLPVVMKRLGQLTGQIRRMGNDFQREINKTTGLDEVRNLRNAITAPLKQTTDQIRRDFNAMTPTGEVQPSGILKPADPKAESVVAEIHAAAGMTPPPAEPVKAAVTPKKVAAKKAPAKAKAVPTAPVTTADLAPIAAAETSAAPAKKAARTPAARKPAATPVATPKLAPKPKVALAAKVTGETVPIKPAPKKRAAAQKPAPSAAKAGTE
ncbi:MAG TPA: Sec-independent protein translocase protein TatB [Devosia sp.]|nr:Sec-independent protein translocase protein TatB [Devosia sp.]